ncbi:hypothetical protein [Lacticaseibacillus camelliae]|uniref:hypothetical protein n=1 Tax=Lacticaseibacillus camelliae TaxID=381742 RepID=UPI001CDACB1D|nr:hypothetical protein [Lacticaseibacillus camelliae]
MGRKTYQRALKLAGTYPYQDKESYVFSTTLHDTDDPTTVVAGNIPEFVRQLKAKKRRRHLAGRWRGYFHRAAQSRLDR